MNRGKIGRRRAVVLAELEKGERNARRNAAQRKRRGMGEWQDTIYPDWSPTAEPPTVPLLRIEHHDDEVADQDAAGHKGSRLRELRRYGKTVGAVSR